jgi:O-acetyl-ADP-ribose deacetylase (regulator of RNase III)
MIIYKQGNVLTGEETHIAHGCNCRGSFGYGIAGQIAKSFPRAKEAYMEKYNSQGWQLGEVQPVDCGSKVIYNCATQYYYGNPDKTGRKYASYDAIESVMVKLYKISKDQDIVFSMPKIGSKLGGLEWEKIELIINQVFSDRNIVVYEYGI